MPEDCNKQHFIQVSTNKHTLLLLRSPVTTNGSSLELKLAFSLTQGCRMTAQNERVDLWKTRISSDMMMSIRAHFSKLDVYSETAPPHETHMWCHFTKISEFFFFFKTLRHVYIWGFFSSWIHKKTAVEFQSSSWLMEGQTVSNVTGPIACRLSSN